MTHVGCPHMCAFCNQHTITGNSQIPHAQDVRRICSKALDQIKDPENTEIAFFGGSFTAIDREYMTELLDAAAPFVGDGGFKGIRISTRPDCIDREILSLLKGSGVTAIELGAQSLDDKVLAANDRGHTAQDVYDASRLIREYGFELGLQLMIGLYCSDEAAELENMQRVLDISPDTVRIYPVVVLERTRLARLLRSGRYQPMSMETVLSVCARMLSAFESVGIRVIKCGLHASEFVERDMIGGFYHPAFRELCESLIYRDAIGKALEGAGISGDGGSVDVVCAVARGCVSQAVGHRRSNTEYFRNKGLNIKIVEDKTVGKYQCEIRR